MALSNKVYRQSLFAAFCALLASTLFTHSSSIADALKRAAIGEHISAQSFAGPNVETVCALQPYQDRLLTKSDLAKGLNARLDAEAFTADEGHFTFLIIRKGDVEVDQIKRSAQLDILGTHELPAEAMLPNQFVQSECSDGQSATLIKLISRERVYLVFGSMHP